MISCDSEMSMEVEMDMDGREKVGIDMVVSSRSVDRVKDHVLVCIDFVGLIHPEARLHYAFLNFHLPFTLGRSFLRCGVAHIQSVPGPVSNVVPRTIYIDGRLK